MKSSLSTLENFSQALVFGLLAGTAAYSATPTPQGGRIEGTLPGRPRARVTAMPAPQAEAGTHGGLSPGSSSQMAVGISVPLGKGEKKAEDCGAVPPGASVGKGCRVIPAPTPLPTRH